MRLSWKLCGVVFVITLLTVSTVSVADIATSKHNLSVSGPGLVKSTTEEEICVFCHTPHVARTDIGILWNRDDSTAIYDRYTSSSLHAAVGQPSGASKLCLSCHDGTIALGSVVSRVAEIPFAGGVRFMPDGAAKLGTNLTDDHPVSFLYDEGLAAGNGELVSPAALTGPVKLDESGMMQCTSCHDPHDDTLGKFLVKPNNFAGLCVTCHTGTGWALSSHATSLATWSGVGADPWPSTEFATVAENACRSCHMPHEAGSPERLLNYVAEEDNCLACHNGAVAATDIEGELLKLYRHAVQDFTQVHDTSEDFESLVTNHVECDDCHNSHRVNASPGNAPLVSGSQLGVSGITASGVAVANSSFQYEICFKCHADNNVLNFAPITRQHAQINTRLEFDLVNPSFHPVEGMGNNPNVPSLLAPLSASSVIYCTDCHTSDTSTRSGGVGPDGPHGSVFPHILESNYTTLDNTLESPAEYALCYGCHNRDSILQDESFAEHDKHVRGEDTPCSACHDPHGVSASQGNSPNNTHLINFDLNIVSPNSRGLMMFEDQGLFRGQCYLSCHGEDHDPLAY